MILDIVFYFSLKFYLLLKVLYMGLNGYSIVGLYTDMDLVITAINVKKTVVYIHLNGDMQ